MKKVAFVYTSMGNLVANTQKLCAELLTGIETVHIADSGLVQDILRNGGVNAQIRMRLMKQFESATLTGANAIVCACSTVGDVAEMANNLFNVPVIRIDQAMIDEACSQYERIGVLASLQTTIEPTTGCIRRTAERMGKKLTILARTAEGAYQAQTCGDMATHDRLLIETALAMKNDIDVLLLAQGSMARMEQAIHQKIGKPVFSSPLYCMKALLEMMKGMED